MSSTDHSAVKFPSDVCCRAIWKPVLSLLLLVTSSALIHAQGISYMRTVGTSGYYPSAIAMDAGRVYATAWRTPAGGLDGEPVAVLLKLDTSGRELWTREFPAFMNIRAVGITGGAVYVHGFRHADPGGRPALFVARYDPEGQELWSRQFDALDDYCCIAADESGVYATERLGENFETGLIRKFALDGRELWTRQIQGAVRAADTSDSGLYVIVLEPQPKSWGILSVRKYDQNGVELWRKPFETYPGWGGLSLVADSTGMSIASQTHLRKYGLSGDVLWTRSLPVPGEDGYVRGLAVDGTGLYVAGSLQGGRIFGALSGQCWAGDSDAFVLKYDTDGNEVWSRQFGTRYGDYPSALALDETAIYLSGKTGNQLFLARMEKASESVTHSRPRIAWECVINAGSFEGGGVAPG